ncbi:retrotransposon protein, putative, ty1-copia subclass [Tanacetum coccineum]
MDGKVHTYKARLVAKGYTQTHGIDCEETFSPVTKIKSIRIMLAIAAFYDYEIWQMDVKTTFFNEKLTEDVFMAQPEGFENAKYPKRVCKLQKAIYGLKQASRSWNLCFHEKVTQFGFSRSEDESCVYVKVSGSVVVFLVLYVDDILLIGNDIPTLQSVKDWLGKCFAMKDLGDAAYILGIKIYRDRSKRLIGLSQDTYLDKILKRFKMENSKKGNLPLHHDIKISKDLFDISRILAKVLTEWGSGDMEKFKARYSGRLHMRMSFENGVNTPAPNPSPNSSFSLLSVLGRERLTGLYGLDAKLRQGKQGTLDVVKFFRLANTERASICAFILEMKGYFDSLLQTAEQGIKKSNVPSTSAAPVLTVGHNAKKRKTSHSNWKGKATQGMLTIGHNAKKRKTSHSNWKGKAIQGKSNRGSKRKVESEIALTSDPKETMCF